MPTLALLLAPLTRLPAPTQVHDTPEADLRVHFTACFGFMEEALASGGGVFVHCFAGRSRSVTVLTAFLMRQQHLTLQVRSGTAALRKAAAPPGTYYDLVGGSRQRDGSFEGGCASRGAAARSDTCAASARPRPAAMHALHRAAAPLRRARCARSVGACPSGRRTFAHDKKNLPFLLFAHAPLAGAQAALALVHAVRPFACPNSGFMRQLQVRNAFLQRCVCASASHAFASISVRASF